MRRELVANAGNQVFVSAVSFWEIAIKSSLGRLAIDMDDLGRNILADRFQELPFNGAHAIRVAKLPAIHSDPFDRALVAQSLVEPMRLLSSDRILEKYWESDGHVVRTNAGDVCNRWPGPSSATSSRSPTFQLIQPFANVLDPLDLREIGILRPQRCVVNLR